MAAVQAGASSCVQTPLWLCHGQGTEQGSPAEQPDSLDAVSQAGIHSLVYWQNAPLNPEWSRRTPAKQEKFQQVLSILTPPGNFYQMRKIQFSDQPLKWMDRNAALEMGDKEVSIMCWAHSGKNMLERNCSTAVPTWFPQEPTLKKKVYLQQFPAACGKATPEVSNTTAASVHCVHTVGPRQELLNKPWSTTDTEQPLSSIKVMISGRAACTHFNILYCSGTEDQFSSAGEFATLSFCWSHSCHIAKTGLHFILSLH